MKTVRSQIFKTSPNIRVYRKDDPQIEVNVTSVDLDTNGKIVILHDEEGNTIYSEDCLIYQDFLDVPGVGYLKPGTMVRLDDDLTKYVLLFGWHTNISNQTIYSWFLRPLEEYSEEDLVNENYMSHYPRDLSQDRTLYLDMIDHLWELTV